jgi:hypothetical protein
LSFILDFAYNFPVHCFWIVQIKSYYGVSRNLLIKFNDDSIDDTPTLAQVLSSEAAISSILDMSIRKLPGDHVLPLQQVLIVNLTSILMGLLSVIFYYTPCRHYQMFHQQWLMQLIVEASFCQILPWEHHGSQLPKKWGTR